MGVQYARAFFCRQHQRFIKNYVLQICDGPVFSPQMFIRRTELSATTKLSAKHESPPIENMLLVASLLSVVIV